MIAETPVLWLGDFLNSKRTHSLIIQATGKGRFYIDALDDEERMMASLEVNLDRLDGDTHWGDAPPKSIYSHLIISFAGSGFGSALREKDVDTDVTVISFAFLMHKRRK